MEIIESPVCTGIYEILYKGRPIYLSSSRAECEQVSSRLESLSPHELIKELEELSSI